MRRLTLGLCEIGVAAFGGLDRRIAPVVSKSAVPPRSPGIRPGAVRSFPEPGEILVTVGVPTIPVNIKPIVHLRAGPRVLSLVDFHMAVHKGNAC